MLALHRYLGRTPSRLLGVALTDAVGDRRTQNQPGTTDEYPNWRVPLTGPDGRPVMLEDVFTDRRAATLAEAVRAQIAPPAVRKADLLASSCHEAMKVCRRRPGRRRCHRGPDWMASLRAPPRSVRVRIDRRRRAHRPGHPLRQRLSLRQFGTRRAGGRTAPSPIPLDLLAFLAGHTSRLGLATGVLVLPNHHPVVLAKRAATVDALSGGRLRLCVGVGWLREEIEACGVDFASRGRRADEQLAVLRALWADQPDGVSHHGEFFNFDNAMCYPKPVAGERLPVHIGGHSRAAARRAGRLGDGFQPLGVAGSRARVTDRADARRGGGGRTRSGAPSRCRWATRSPRSMPNARGRPGAIRAPTGSCWPCRRPPISSRPRTCCRPAPNGCPCAP